MSSAHFVHLPYTPDLTQGGIAWALHSLPHAYAYQRMAGSPYEWLRRAVAQAAVELAFRRHLAGQDVPFEVKGAAPFTEPDRYSVMLGGRRCDLKTFLISRQEQISQLERDPQILPEASVLVPSDEHAGAGHSQHDLYIFAYVLSLTSQAAQQRVIGAEPTYFPVHVMPAPWSRPALWNPLGKLVVKSESEQPQTVELAGQDRGRVLRFHVVELPPRGRVEVEIDFFSLTYLHARCRPAGRIGIYSPARQQTHLIGATDWGNIWVHGLDIVLAGFLAHDEFGRRARFVPAGTRVFASTHTQVKSLAVPISDLRPLSELFERVKIWKS